MFTIILIITLTVYLCTYILNRTSMNVEMVRPGIPAAIHQITMGFFLLSVVCTIALAIVILHSFGVQVNPKPIGL